MSRPREIGTCRCGAEFCVSTYLPSNRQPIWHCECPTCEVISQRVVAAVAVALNGSHLGLILVRIAQ